MGRRGMCASNMHLHIQTPQTKKKGNNEGETGDPAPPGLFGNPTYKDAEQMGASFIAEWAPKKVIHSSGNLKT